MIHENPWNVDLQQNRPPEHVDRWEYEYQQLKSAIHQQLVESMDLSQVGHIDQKQLRDYVRSLTPHIAGARKDVMNRLDYERLQEELMFEVFGLGPLEKLMQDPTVTDILVNDAYSVFVEREGRLEPTNVIFADDEHLVRIIQRIVSRVGRRIDETSPMVDARLPDGSRVNAVLPPLALDGPSVSIRRFGARPLRIDDLLATGSILPNMVRFLEAAIQSRIGCVVSGGTGAGKTTLLNVLSRFIPADERLVTVEDSAELILQHKHRVRMETRPPNTEGIGEVTQRDLVRNSLRMRPDRIIVGEVRGAEVWDMLQAMNTGHEGSLTTIHANSAVDALSRLEMMVAMTGYDLPIQIVREYIAAGIKLIVHVARLKGGVRRVTDVSEIVSVAEEKYRLEPIFVFEQQDVSSDGVALGQFYVTGYRPACLHRITAAGIQLPDDLFCEQRIDTSAASNLEIGIAEEPVGSRPTAKIAQKPEDSRPTAK